MQQLQSVVRPGCGSLRIGFVMEQVLGHASWYRNLRAAVEQLGGVEPTWVETWLHDPNGLIERLPGLPSFVRTGLRSRLDARRGLAGRRQDVLVFSTQTPATFCQPELRRTPSILMTDATPAQLDRLGLEYGRLPSRIPLIQRAKSALARQNFHLARRVVAWSPWVERSLVEEYGLPPERVEVIPQGLDLRRWCPPAAPRAAERPQLLFVGGDLRRKGGALLREVFLAARWYERADLHLVTRDSVEPGPGMFVHHGLTGDSPALRALYARADLFVLPTLGDCLPQVLLEALAVGLPVVATEVGGIPDLLGDGEIGELIPPDNAPALHRAIARLLDCPELRRRRGGAARRRAVERFDIMKNAARILEVCAEVAEEGRR